MSSLRTLVFAGHRLVLYFGLVHVVAEHLLLLDLLSASFSFDVDALVVPLHHLLGLEQRLLHQDFVRVLGLIDDQLFTVARVREGLA